MLPTDRFPQMRVWVRRPFAAANGLLRYGTEPRLTPASLSAAARLVDDPNPKVLLQLACTLGQWNDPRASQALGRLAIANHSDKFIVAAVMSSAVARKSTDKERQLFSAGVFVSRHRTS